MYKVNNLSMAKETAKEHNLHYGMSILDGKWYIGTEEELEKTGCVDIDVNESLSKSKILLNLLEVEKPFKKIEEAKEGCSTY